ncbi:hypothetical protein Glove_115g6 [Diversispora epigaea]|uniref:Glutaredoxin domain-containing protein n=1 Tax=Diversispora epigaea TaxID=1348612 RepID=A0A397J9W4_9GLOM|nr:hypothetical protein Glove_115g6 [Diversispora epigaea]
MTKETLLPLYNPTFYNPYKNNQQRRNSLVEVGDHYLRTKKYRILGVTLGIFLCSLWAVAHFSGIDRYQFIKGGGVIRDGAALAAAIVLGENGEEGIHGLEVENHGHYHDFPHDYRQYFHDHYIIDDDEENENSDGNYNNEKATNELEIKITMTTIERELYQENGNENKNKNLKKLNYNVNDDLENDVEYEIDELINENPVVVFIKIYCPYSQRVKHILSQYDILPHPIIIEVDKRGDEEEVKKALIKFTHRETFPNVFIDGKPIGGSDELAILHTNGQLKELLIESGALFDEVFNEKVFDYYDMKHSSL